MDATALRTQLLALTTRLREEHGDERACVYMQIDPTEDQPYQIWLHADGLREHGRATNFEADTAAHVLDVASYRIGIEDARRALGWEREVEWIEASHPCAIPTGTLDTARAKQDAATWWIEDHPREVAAERAAQAEATRLASDRGKQSLARMLAGSDTAFKTQRRRTA